MAVGQTNTRTRRLRILWDSAPFEGMVSSWVMAFAKASFVRCGPPLLDIQTIEQQSIQYGDDGETGITIDFVNSESLIGWQWMVELFLSPSATRAGGEGGQQEVDMLVHGRNPVLLSAPENASIQHTASMTWAVES